MDADNQSPVLYSIGHSNRDYTTFLQLLKAHGIKTLADIRSMPGSRRLPQFNAETLAAALADDGIAYVPLKTLGGRRKPSADSPNTAWRHPAFRAYADHMTTPEFAAGLAELLTLATQAPTVMMCAEAVPWRCHRNLVADAATLLHKWQVRHIMTPTQATVHKPQDFAVIEGDHLKYPADDLFA